MRSGPPVQPDADHPADHPPTPQAWEAQPYGGTWLTAGAQAGFYTARSYKRDIVRGDPNAAVLATDTAAQKAAKRNAIATCRINAAIDGKRRARLDGPVRVPAVGAALQGHAQQRRRRGLQPQLLARVPVPDARRPQSTIKNAPDAFTRDQAADGRGARAPARSDCRAWRTRRPARRRRRSSARRLRRRARTGS